MATRSASPTTAEAFAPLAIDRSRASPNHGPRAPGRAIDMLLLHYTGMRDGPSAVDWLCNPASQVSCHYVVHEDGTIRQLVPDERRAWHAGRSIWAGETDINSVSLGIEIVNGGHDFGLPPFPPDQIEAVVRLCRHLAAQHAVPPARVLAHSDVAPSRKRDPGERFPWAELAAEGVGHWVETKPDLHAGKAEPLALQRALADYGYGIAETGVIDADTESVVRAFQRHFRPDRIDGQADAALAHHLDTLRRRRATEYRSADVHQPEPHAKGC